VEFFPFFLIVVFTPLNIREKRDIQNYKEKSILNVWLRLNN